MDATAWATVWVFIAMIVFIGIVLYLKLPDRIVAALDSRADKIRADLEEARRLREEAQALLADYQRRRREAETEAEAIVEQAKRQAAAFAKEAKERLTDYVARRQKAVEARIGQAEAQAIADVRARAIDVASAAAARILAAEAKGKGGDRFVEEAIGEVRKRMN